MSFRTRREVHISETVQEITWSKAEYLPSLSGQPVKIRFELTNGKLYSFWVTPDPDGASYGYIAAGGPSFAGPVDEIPR